MGFRINTNTSSISAQKSLNRTTQSQQDTISKMSSGSRITKAADDAAGLAISEKLKSQMKSLQQANRNANDGISMIQVAEGGLTEVTEMLTRLRELSVQAASDTVGDTEREFSNMEYQNLKQEIERISQTTEFNGIQLLNGEGDNLDFQIGTRNDDFKDRIQYDSGQANSTLGALGIDGVSVVSKADAQDGLGVLDSAIEKVSGQRAALGAVQNRLQVTSRSLEVSNENMAAANSRIRDVDYASVTSENAKNNILSQAGTAVLAQANAQGQQALRLIG
jgi:flagellin